MKVSGNERKYIFPGTEVDIVLKKDQDTEKLKRGFVKDVLTKSENHSQGIKVRLEDGSVGRVQNIISFTGIE